MAERGPHGNLTEYASKCIFMLCLNLVHKKNYKYLIVFNEYL